MAQPTRLPVLSAPPPLKNLCGGCTACCDVLSVEELGKPFYTRCAHLTPGACRDYDNRPKSCAMFRCAWHAGIFGDSADRRPDRCGLMFDLSPVDNPPVLKVWEVIPGSLADMARVQYLIKKMREHKLIRNIRLGNPSVIFFPYGATLAMRMAPAPAFAHWPVPTTPGMQLRRLPVPYQDQAWFEGAVGPLRMPGPVASASGE